MKANINFFGVEDINIECEQISVLKNLIALAAGVGRLDSFDGKRTISLEGEREMQSLFESIDEAMQEVMGGKPSSHFYFNEILIDIRR